MKFVNYTPHEINLVTDGQDTAIPVSGWVARSETLKSDRGYLNARGLVIPLVSYEHIGAVLLNREDILAKVDPPRTQAYTPPSNGEIFITSKVFAQLYPHKNVYSPAEFVRNAKGHVVGCGALDCSLSFE